MPPPSDLDPFLRPTRYLDCDAPAVRAYAAEAIGEATTDLERAIRLYYAVRDGIWYDPYAVSLDPETYRASAVARAASAFCIQKAILLAAAARAVGIPSRLGYADVRNHLASEKLLALMGTDVFIFHGYVELHLAGRWVKATPAFNLALCERFGVRPLEFDGRTDAVLHPFDAHGRRHMEYLRDRGSHADFPFEEMARAFRESYPRMIEQAPPAGGDRAFARPA
jgi:transglutaminase-like putative cysteine protease